MYSEGAINSMVADLISGLLCGSPYVLVTGSKENSSGTAKDTTDLNLWSISKFQWTSENSTPLCDDPEPPPPPKLNETFMFMYMSSFCMKTQLSSYPVKGSCLTNSGEQKKKKRNSHSQQHYEKLQYLTLGVTLLTLIDPEAEVALPSTLINKGDKGVDVGAARSTAHNHTGLNHRQLLKQSPQRLKLVAETESIGAEISCWYRVHKGWN